jgi:hypothetical protein
VHHVGVAVEFDEIVDVVLGEPPQLQAFGFQKTLHVVRCQGVPTQVAAR